MVETPVEEKRRVQATPMQIATLGFDCGQSISTAGVEALCKIG